MKIRIPKDSITETETAGLIGEVYLSVDTTQASGASIENYGYLKSKPGKNTLSLGDQLKAEGAVVRLVQALREAEKEVPKDSSTPIHP